MLESLLRSTIRDGRITILHDTGASATFGDRHPEVDDVTLRLHGAMTSTWIALNPDLRFGEAYVDGRLEIERGTLDGLFELIGRNLANRPAQPRAIAALQRALNRRGGAQKPRASKHNVAHHYDLSEAMYRLFLDPDLQYSCAYFESPDADLSTAQQAKIRHIIAKLDLQPGQRILDIGCGWGGLAIAVAQACDVHVTGITLSRQQLEVARSRAADGGLAGRVTFELMDYRDTPGQFDRIVSVGMFEHVGPSHYPTYFDAIQRALSPEGVALIHSIGARADGGGSNAWMEKYIFPGGYVPTLSETLRAIETTRLWVSDVEVLRLHYAHTLQHWLRRFRDQRAAVRRLYDERFCRMWEFYLASCAMAFRHGDLMVMQIQLAKRVDTLPITRSYMTEAETQLAHAQMPHPAIDQVRRAGRR